MVPTPATQAHPGRVAEGPLRRTRQQWGTRLGQASLQRQAEPGLRIRGLAVGILMGAIMGGFLGAYVVTDQTGLDVSTAVLFSVVAGAVCSALAGMLLGVHNQRPVVRSTDVLTPPQR